MISIITQSTLENGKVVLHTTAGDFVGTARGGLTAADDARQIMLRETGRFIVSVADDLQERNKGNASIWRGHNDYNEAKCLALLFMAHNPDASVVVYDRNAPAGSQMMFTNRRELCA